jgi:hypothetical protein
LQEAIPGWEFCPLSQQRSDTFLVQDIVAYVR